MFKDIDDEFELDVLSQRSHDSDEEESGKRISLIRRLSKKNTLSQVMASLLSLFAFFSLNPSFFFFTRVALLYKKYFQNQRV